MTQGNIFVFMNKLCAVEINDSNDVHDVQSPSCTDVETTSGVFNKLVSNNLPLVTVPTCFIHHISFLDIYIHADHPCSCSGSSSGTSSYADSSIPIKMHLPEEHIQSHRQKKSEPAEVGSKYCRIINLIEGGGGGGGGSYMPGPAEPGG